MKIKLFHLAVGCYFLDDIKEKIQHKNVYVYGYESSREYPKSAGANLVDDPADADVILLAASLVNHNHRTYKSVHQAFENDPNKSVICLNPDHYVYYQSQVYMPVMGFMQLIRGSVRLNVSMGG